MAGYSGYSKSNNALDAERQGRFPASVLAKKLKVNTAAIKELMRPSEWHHTSCHYNATNFYDGQLLLAVAAGGDELLEYDEEDLFDSAELLLELRGYQAAGQAQVWEDCAVRWLEWSGGRKHPTCTERAAEHCRIEFNGQSTYIITLPGGAKLTKRQGTNGFAFRRNLREAV